MSPQPASFLVYEVFDLDGGGHDLDGDGGGHDSMMIHAARE